MNRLLKLLENLYADGAKHDRAQPDRLLKRRNLEPDTADLLLSEDIAEIVIYDNFVRGRKENLAHALSDSRVRVFDIGGDILQTDILEAALEGADGVFHFAALWLLQCHEYPRSAFDVNVRGTFNVMEACVRKAYGAWSTPPRLRCTATRWKSR